MYVYIYTVIYRIHEVDSLYYDKKINSKTNYISNNKLLFCKAIFVFLLHMIHFLGVYFCIISSLPYFIIHD